MSNGRILSRHVEPDKLQGTLQHPPFHHKAMSIPLQHVSLYYELELLRNVFIGDNGLLLKNEIPTSSQSPIHKVFKGMPLSQLIANSTTASVLVPERDLSSRKLRLTLLKLTKHRFSFVKVRND